jgi:hypothetical protein
MFSSDDSRESADLVNYESPRIFKNKRKGAWWDTGDSAHSTPNAKKTRMTRNYDSGVYMMSEGSDSCDSLPPPHRPPFGFDGACDNMPEEDSLHPQQSKEETEFCERLHEGLEKNSETYDFSNCDLEDSDIQQIGQLASVIKNVPDPGNDLPTAGQYRSLVPRIYVNLNGNRLRRLTPFLFEVQNLNTLVLVNNEIDELPAEICQLRALRELNISRNNIRWLPFECLELFQTHMGNKLAILGDSGVPWLMPKIEQVYLIEGEFQDHRQEPVYQFVAELGHAANNLVVFPTDDQFYKTIAMFPGRDTLAWYMTELEARSRHLRRGSTTSSPLGLNHPETQAFPHHPHIESYTPGLRLLSRYMGRTPVSYFDQSGALVEGSPKPPTSNDDDFATITETDRGAHGIPASWFTPPNFQATNSLLTMAMNTALHYKDQEDLTIADVRERIGDPLPSAVETLLEQAESNDAGGYGALKKCTLCRKDYVVARAEWIEWWCVQSTKFLPFKVKVCSWACVPEAMRERPKELDWDAEAV